MAKPADIGSKRLISLAPDAWVQWVTQRPDIVAGEILSSEFQWLSRESDVLLKASSPEHGEFLVLNELQLRYTPRMPQRMRAYAALAEEKYNLPVYPVLINILQPTPGVVVATGYQSEYMGLQARQDYRTINLWEVDAEIVFQQPLPSLLPFVPVLRGGDNESAVRQAVQLLRNDQQLSELEPLLAFFARFVLSTPLVQQIMRWDMVVLQQSPWYQEILQQEALRILRRQLQRRFGEVPANLQVTLQGLNLEQLEELVDVAVTVNSLNEFIASVPPPSENATEPA